MTDPVGATVVVPSFNRPTRLAECLGALAALRPPPGGFEVVVVDDGSPSPLATVCAPFEPLVRCLRQPNRGPAAARNAGAAAARREFLAFTDDDCRPEPGWLGALIARHGGVPGRLVGGRVVNLLEVDPFASASQSLCDFLYEWWGAEAGTMPFFTSNNLGGLRADFLSLGGFDETFPLAAAEDREFGLRWRDRWGDLAYAPEAVVGHRHAMSLRGYLRQHANYGRGARHLHRLLDAKGDPRPRVEALRFYLALVAHPLRRGRLGQSALMLLSQVAMVGGYVMEGRRPAEAGGSARPGGRGRSRDSA